MRCMLHSAGLGPEYWSYALLHATYMKNRLPHQALNNKTPFELYTSKTPDLSSLRVFGCQVYVRDSQKRKAKLDSNVRHGIYLGHTATPKNIHYRDHKTGFFKTGTHVIYDEAHMTLAREKIPPAAVALQNLGYNNEGSHGNKRGDQFLHVQLLSRNATMPSKGTVDSAGLDIFSAVDIIVKPHDSTIVPTDIAVQCPRGTYFRLATRSSFAAKGLDCKGGVIDPDYRGNIKIILRNDSDTPYQINQGSKIVQGIVEKFSNTIPVETHQLDSTKRNEAGFGSTDTTTEKVVPVIKMVDAFPRSDTPNNSAEPTRVLDYPMELPYNIYFSTDPYNNHLTHSVSTSGTHKTLGLDLRCDDLTGRLQLSICIPGTPAARITKWRSQLQKSSILTVDGKHVSTILDVENAVKEAQTKQVATIDIDFGTIDKVPLHPSYGVPQLHFDQLNVIAHHLHDMNGFTCPDCTNADATSCPQVIAKAASSPRFTRRILQQHQDWNMWEKAEYKMHDDYEQQEKI